MITSGAGGRGAATAPCILKEGRRVAVLDCDPQGYRLLPEGRPCLAVALISVFYVTQQASWRRSMAV